MKFVVSLLFGFTLSFAASAASKSHWSYEMRGGVFEPSISNWSTYYKDPRPVTGSVALSFKIFRFFEIGGETGYLRAQGKGLLPLNGTLGGDVTYELLPISALATLRLTFTDRQWVVPYVSGGWNRVTYRQTIKGQDPTMGSAQGLIYKGGLQILLDPLDNTAANYLRDDYGVSNTFLTFEYRKNKALVNNIDLGGTAYSAGIMMEF